MSSPSFKQSQFWIRFFCGLIFFGTISALIGLRYLDSMGTGITITACVAFTLIVSIIGARSGFSKLLDSLWWW